LKDHIPENAKLPSGFHVVGHVALVHLDSSLYDYASMIGEATLLFDEKIKSIAIKRGPTTGEIRTPLFEVIAGDCNTVTTHIENGVLFKLDPVKITFSGGNKRERIDIAKQVKQGERVVDMFSCVGQFALQIAKTSESVVTAIEINPVAYKFLLENIRINKLENRVTAILGDCREVYPSNYANRVIMGYLHDTQSYLPYALDTLTKDGGTIHMHMTIQKDLLEQSISEIDSVCRKTGFVSQIEARKIKSYSPNVEHYVFDIQVKPF